VPTGDANKVQFSTKQSANVSQVDALPTASGGIARAAFAFATQAGCDVETLLKFSGLTLQQIKNRNIRIGVGTQIKFLNLVAEALKDDSLGVHLALHFNLKELGLLYYVPASSASLGDALRRLARYSTIYNEGIHVKYSRNGAMSVALEYCGVSRLNDRHQIEFFVTTLVRICQQLTGRSLQPISIKLVHRRIKVPAEFKCLFGCDIAYGSDIDTVAYSKSAECVPIIGADPFLNSLLVKYCDEALSNRRKTTGRWRLSVENAIAPLLPHGQARMADISRQLGLSQRTLARRLASEGLTFVEVLDGLRFDLAKQYLREPDLMTSEVGWLLGYRESSAFNHAFKRWTGKTPRQLRR
jgi:AraC-like DNA-binding protein